MVGFTTLRGELGVSSQWDCRSGPLSGYLRCDFGMVFHRFSYPDSYCGRTTNYSLTRYSIVQSHRLMLYHLPFAKYQGAGNDFIILRWGDILPIVSQDSLALSSGVITSLCDRHFGVGADGLMVITPSTGFDYQFTMDFFNSDGQRASMCGNGARCAYLFAYAEGYVGREAFFRTDIGVISGRFPDGGEISIGLSDVASMQEEPLSGGILVNTGVPHLVLEVLPAELDCDWLIPKAREYRSQVQPETGGVNVNFFAITPGGVRMRTFERGVEGETLACGTGAVAVALTVAYRAKLPSPIQLHAPGGSLSVQFAMGEQAGSWRSIRLEGGAKEVFRGIFPVEL